jgi:DNA-binding transcriptional LysR family regulator
MSFELKHLNYFLAVADELSFRRAAKLIGVGQPAISRRISALEDELGATLFERGNTGVKLTEAGRVFLEDIRRITIEIDSARRSVASVAFGTSGRLRLGICEDATTPKFSEILSAYRKNFPAVDLRLIELPSALQVRALAQGEMDIGILLPPVDDTIIQVDKLWCDDWLVIMPSNHRLAKMDSIPLDALADENFITSHPDLGPGGHTQSQQIFTEAGVEPHIVACALRRVTMVMLVQSGAGVALLPGAFRNITIDGIAKRPLACSGHKMQVAAAYPKGDLQGTVAQFLRIATATSKTKLASI